MSQKRNLIMMTQLTKVCPRRTPVTQRRNKRNAKGRESTVTLAAQIQTTFITERSVKSPTSVIVNTTEPKNVGSVRTVDPILVTAMKNRKKMVRILKIVRTLKIRIVKMLQIVKLMRNVNQVERDTRRRRRKRSRRI